MFVIMLINDSTDIRIVNGVHDSDIQRIKDFLQGSVYCWCKNRKNEWFSLRDLMGGDNFYWEKTPLFVLWDKHNKAGKKGYAAIVAAGKDCGWILKRVINDDKRKFESKIESQTKHYRWIV
jgi:hypothetical protein